MIVIAVKTLAALHALPAVACLHTGLNVLSLPGSPHLPRARIWFVGSRMLVTSLLLFLCIAAAFVRPGIGWLFALGSLVMYLPEPASAKSVVGPSLSRSPLTTRVMGHVPRVAAIRFAAVLLLAAATFWPSG
jgi:hypothetical protein